MRGRGAGEETLGQWDWRCGEGIRLGKSTGTQEGNRSDDKTQEDGYKIKQETIIQKTRTMRGNHQLKDRLSSWSFWNSNFGKTFCFCSLKLDWQWQYKVTAWHPSAHVMHYFLSVQTRNAYWLLSYYLQKNCKSEYVWKALLYIISAYLVFMVLCPLVCFFNMDANKGKCPHQCTCHQSHWLPDGSFKIWNMSHTHGCDHL